MAAPYTVRLGYLQRPGPFAVDLYVCPPGIRTVVRDFVCYHSSAAAQTFLSVRIAPPGDSVYAIALCLSGALQLQHFELRQALSPGDVLVVTTTDTAPQLAVTGYELTL